MDPQLKQLMKELGDAINECLSDSKQISEVVSRIKESGYNIFLVLEATIGASKQGEKAPDKTSLVSSISSNAELKVSDQDDTLTESELKRRSASSVENFYRDAHRECSLERKPNPKAMQQLVTAWKVLHGWGWK